MKTGVFSGGPLVLEPIRDLLLPGVTAQPPLTPTLELLDKIQEQIQKAVEVPAKYLQEGLRGVQPGPSTTRTVSLRHSIIMQAWMDSIQEMLNVQDPDYAAITRAVARGG